MSTAYEIVTESIIKQLESGVAPWRKPWRTEPPANLVSKKEYRGINIFLLASQGYGSRYWITYRQAQVLDGSVKKGQHGSKLSSGRLTNTGRRTRKPEKRKTENRFCCATSLFLIWSNAKESNLLNRSRSSNRSTNASTSSTPCRIHLTSSRIHVLSTGHLTIRWVRPPGRHSILSRLITPRSSTN